MPIKLVPVHQATIPGDTLSRRQAADMLQMNPRGVEKLLTTGYLPDLSVSRIVGLARRPVIHADGQQPVLRQAPAELDTEDDRDYLGEGAALTDEQQVEADRQWWRCDPEAVVNAGLLPVTISGFFTTVLKIHGVEVQVRRVIPGSEGRKSSVEVRYGFHATLAGRVRALGEPESDYIAPDLSNEEREAVLTFLGGRSTARSGGPIAYLPRS